jgi:hypothetical protein
MIFNRQFKFIDFSVKVLLMYSFNQINLCLECRRSEEEPLSTSKRKYLFETFIEGIKTTTVIFTQSESEFHVGAYSIFILVLIHTNQYDNRCRT